MEKQVKRPYLLSGLIVNIICFAILSISGIINIFAVAAALSGVDVSGAESMIVFVFLVYILLLAFCILGIVFSAVSIARLRLSPSEFAKKRGMIITAFVFDIIIVVLILIGLISTFSVLSLIMALILICAAVFIMLDTLRNNKYVKEEQATAQDAAQINVVDTTQTTESTNSEIENKDKE